MVPIQEMIRNLLTKAGLPDFPLDKDGFPAPGAVVRYFRERMRYTDPHAEKEKSWTQVDLAKRLGISEVSIRLMETQNKGLDSIERRRVLADILKIPAVLLGLGSISDLVEFLNHPQDPTPLFTAPSTAVKNGGVENETMQLYQDAFLVYSAMHSSATAQGAIFDIEQWIHRIEHDLPSVQKSPQHHQLQRTLWHFHDLSTRIYSDKLDWINAFDHLNSAMSVANALNSNELKMVSLYRSGTTKMDQRSFFAAKADLEAAVKYAQHVTDPCIKGATLSAAGLAYALADADTAGRTSAQRLLDQAESYAHTVSTPNPYDVHFNVGMYFRERSDALLAIGRPAKALEALDDAEMAEDPTQKRYLTYLNILRAEAYMKLKHPQFDTALQLLTDAFDTSKLIKSAYNINYIRRLYKALATSSYGTSPIVADLGMKLREWRNVK